MISSSKAQMTLRDISTSEKIRILIFFYSIFFSAFTWYSHSLLSEYDVSRSNVSPSSDHPLDRMMQSRAKEAPPPPPKKAILWDALGGQGTGNVINGLLGAHLLADDYGYTVCIKSYASFQKAFTQIQTTFEKEFCKEAWANPGNPQQIRDINYAGKEDECGIHLKMVADGHVKYVGNTYPRWRQVPDGYFLQHYKPTPLLKSILPWGDVPPNVVVHLRKEDGRGDKRKGLDDATFHALGKLLPEDTFLITNKVDWFDWFSEKYGWLNSGWHDVTHSVGGRKNWGKRHENEKPLYEQHNMTEKEWQGMQMWSDWFTILSAKQLVIHTWSDFSHSAVHWMGMPSKFIEGNKIATEDDLKEDYLRIVAEAGGKGIKKGETIAWLRNESWFTEGIAPAIKDRDIDNLRGCSEAELDEIRKEKFPTEDMIQKEIKNA